jgi:NAD(P)-dependent dehydrogenase (short-subunit alcohol dehydrogenase family)
MRYGRDVFAVPGSRRNPAAEGCNELIRDGAHPLLRNDDVLLRLGCTPGSRRGPTHLINNAGISGSIPDKLDLDMWDRQFSINARGMFLGVRAVVPTMQQQRSGSIVNISSISGVVGQAYVHMGYNAAKGAVRTMTKAAAVQYAPDNVRVNSVHPGIMPPMRTSKLTADPAVREKMIRAVPMRREGRIEEVAYANLFLASDEASYITGVELMVDGGYTAS